MPLLLVEEHVENFWPLSLTRATFELRYGALSPLERALKQSGEIVLRARDELAPYLRAKYGLPVNTDHEGELFPGLPFATPWETLGHSDALIAADFEMVTAHTNYRDTGMMTGAHIVGRPAEVFLGPGALVQPGCVLDVTQGPIIIAANAHVKWSHLQGPVFVGPGCLIEAARLRPGASIGAHSKVGGEISASIFQSRVNKAHDGFVGNTWAGRWVNFGALATTSNLKNTYSNIRFQQSAERSVDTGTQFLGSLIGDHTKLGILQGLTTGSHIGVGCNIFGGGIAPRLVPSFSWGGQAGWHEYRLCEFLNTVRATLARRTANLRAESESVLTSVFADSGPARMQFLNSVNATGRA